MKNNLSFLVSIGALSLLSSCSSGDKVLAEVGSYRITKKQAQYRDELILFQYPQEKRKLGLDQLVRSYLNAEILRNNGRPITQEVLDQEEARIDKQTLMPDKLAQIKGIFGTDHEGYQKVYVLPVFADRVIYYEYFLKDPRIHQHSKDVAQAFLDQAAKAKSFEEFSKAKDKKVLSFAVSENGGFEWDLDKKLKEGEPSADSSGGDPAKSAIMAKVKAQQKESINLEGQRWIREYISPTATGNFIPNIIDYQDQWLVARVTKRDDQKKFYRLEGVFFPKEDYAKWYETEKAKVQVKTYN